jgi:hypothetical protein
MRVRPFAAARRLLAAPLGVLTLAIGLAAGAAPAAHAGPGCTWVPITLQNGWVSENGAWGTGNPSYCEEANGMVYLSGSLAGELATSGTFGTLPSQAWPLHEIYLDVYTYGSSYGVLRIDTDETMEAYNGSANEYTSLAGVSFPSGSINFQTTAIPLENGWQSDQGTYNTGDPAYAVDSNDIVHLSGSLHRPAGTAPDYSNLWTSGALPSTAVSADDCFDMDVYSIAGGIANLESSYGNIMGGNAQYTSLAGISYPAVPKSAWHTLSLLAGSAYCPMAPSVYAAANVVYLTGYIQFPAGFDGEITVLPAADRPTHVLYMIANTGGTFTTVADQYLTVQIDPDGSVRVYSPPNGTASFVALSGLSFHLGS